VRLRRHSPAARQSIANERAGLTLPPERRQQNHDEVHAAQAAVDAEDLARFDAWMGSVSYDVESELAGLNALPDDLNAYCPVWGCNRLLVDESCPVPGHFPEDLDSHPLAGTRDRRGWLRK